MGGRIVIWVILGVVDRVVWAPFNDKARFLEKGLAVAEGKGFNTGNGGVGNRELGPAVSGNDGAGGKGHEMAGALGVASGVQGNGAHGACMRGVGGLKIVEHLGIATELNAHGSKIGTRLSGDKSSRAKGVGNTVGPREKIEEAGDLDDSPVDENFRKATVWEAMYKRSKTLLDGADGPLNFANVAVRGDNVEVNVREMIADAFKFMIAMDVAEKETTLRILVDDGSERTNNGGAGPVGEWCNGAETKVARDGVKETELLHEKEINAQGNVAMVLEYRGGKRHSFEAGGAGSGGGTGGLAFEGGNIRAVNGKGAVGVINGDGAVENVMVTEDGVKNLLIWTSEHAVELASEISLMDLALREHFFMLGYCVE